MNLLHWLTSRFSTRKQAVSLYKRGMIRANKHDHAGAIEDYTQAIAMSDVPPDVKAMALYNRGMVYAASGELTHAVADLNAVLAMPQALTHVKTEARRKLVRMQRRSDSTNA